MELNAQQKVAVEYLDGPLLVLAGPGTGKTQLLSSKVAYILEKTDTNPENILCLTFTETGASNMRERLKTLIGRSASKVNIGTYHSFGKDILAQYKNYNENYDRNLDSALDELSQFKIIKTLQEALSGKDILRGDQVKDIIDVISEAKRARLTDEDLLKIAKQNERDSNELSEQISPLLKNVVRGKYLESLENAYKPIFLILEPYLDVDPILPNVKREATILAESLAEALAEAEANDSIKALTKWRDDNFEKDTKDNYRLKDRIANKKLRSLANLMRQYDTYLKENGLFDFDDMIEEAVKALKEDAGFRMTLQERYQYILLDEFQDTNPSQFAIVKALTDYEKPMIMAVGDDDQAIYEFQGALASNLKDFQTYYDAKVIPLVENYRSTQEILDFASEIIALAPDKKFGVKKLEAHRQSPKESQIFRYEFESSDSEYGFVAEKIADLVADGVKQSNIAVISRKTKYFEPLLPYLKGHNNIKIAYEKRDNLFEDEKIHEVLTIARFVYEFINGLRPTTQLMEILSFPCFNVSMLEVSRLSDEARREHVKSLEYFDEHGSDSLKTAVSFLIDLAKKTSLEPIDAILFDIADKIANCDMGEYEKFCFYENLASLKGKLQKHYSDKKIKLKDLIDLVDDYEAAGMPLNTTSPYKDAEDAVQLMTAHAAKGLEFEYVFIISADDRAWGKAKGNNSFLTLPKNLTHIRHTGITDSERLRVMYVALTRAKNTLIITNSVQDFSGARPARLEYFNEYDSKDGDGNDIVVSPMMPQKIVKKISAPSNITMRENNIKNWIRSTFVESPDMRVLLRERMANFKMSASALTKFVNIIYGGPQDFYSQYVVKIDHEPESFRLIFGTLVHEVLEKVTKENISDGTAVEFYLQLVDDYDTTLEIKKILREIGPDSILASLREFGDIIRKGKAEVNFGAENIAVGGVPITGKIDHIVVDDGAKTIEIYDYKTGSYHDGKWDSEPSLFDYMLQLEFYKLLINGSREYAKYKVTKGHILYVKADNDGVVYDKVYDFGDKIQFLYRGKTEYAFDIHELIKVVYDYVLSLDFLDDPEIFVEANKNLNMKQEKDFIKLLLARNTKK